MTEAEKRWIVLDTETTGMNKDGGPTYLGHRIIEIGAVEVINRRLTGKSLHLYIQPDREVDPEAIGVHGITDEFLQDKPEYAAVHNEFLDFVRGAEIIAHNAPFDIGFINQEFAYLDPKIGKIEDYCTITDSLVLAKKRHPGKKNNLDILSQRYGVDNSKRTLHGALLDAQILADIYLLMTGGQTSLRFANFIDGQENTGGIVRVKPNSYTLMVQEASLKELQAHEKRLDLLEKSSDNNCMWRK